MPTSPTLDDLASLVRTFSKERDWEQYHSPRNLAMALSVEASELLELFLWCSDDGPQPLNERRRDKVAQEAADVMICLLNFCERANVDLAPAVVAKLQGAAKKYPVDRVKGKALKYDEYTQWSEEE